ncbi:hypothetical protein [uncultured Paraglaciecola sp.]
MVIQHIHFRPVNVIARAINFCRPAAASIGVILGTPAEEQE